MMDIYQQQIIDLAKNPLNRRELEGADLTHSGVNVTCGDHVRLYLSLEEKEGHAHRILEASWQGEGCAISVAAASVLTEELKGFRVDKARLLDNADMLKWLGITLGPARLKCGVLCLETLHGALRQL